MYVVFLDLQTRKVFSYVASSYENYFSDYAHMKNTLYLDASSFLTETHREHFIMHYKDYYMDNTGVLFYKSSVVSNDNTY